MEMKKGYRDRGSIPAGRGDSMIPKSRVWVDVRRSMMGLCGLCLAQDIQGFTDIERGINNTERGIQLERE